jgi:hypothetical protein
MVHSDPPGTDCEFHEYAERRDATNSRG